MPGGYRRYMQPAPTLSGGMCSDCRVPVMAAGDGEYRICPKCYAVLWHKDWAAEFRIREKERASERARKAAEVRDMRFGAKRGAHVYAPKTEPAGLRWQRQRLVGLIAKRALLLYGNGHNRDSEWV